jgi:hypothetical protein
MPAPAPAMVALLATFAPAFTARTFARAVILLYGTLLAGGPRTVTAALRAVGRTGDTQFGADHRVLSRGRWSPLALSRLLLGLLVTRCLAPDEPLLLAIDETLERRRGRKIAWRSWLRDPVRSGAGGHPDRRWRLRRDRTRADLPRPVPHDPRHAVAPGRGLV